MATTAAPVTTREDIIQIVQSRLGLSSKAAAKNTVTTVLGTIAEELIANGKKPGYTMRLNDFLTFKVIAVAAKTGRNPQTGEKKAIPARTKVKVTLSKGLRDLGK